MYFHRKLDVNPEVQKLSWIQFLRILSCCKVQKCLYCSASTHPSTRPCFSISLCASFLDTPPWNHGWDLWMATNKHKRTGAWGSEREHMWFHLRYTEGLEPVSSSCALTGRSRARVQVGQTAPQGFSPLHQWRLENEKQQKKVTNSDVLEAFYINGLSFRRIFYINMNVFCRFDHHLVIKGLLMQISILIFKKLNNFNGSMSTITNS